MKQLPRALIISHNAMRDDTNNGRTLAELFRGWDTDKIAQMYLYKQLPISDVCKNFYRVSDFDVLESITKFKKPGAKVTSCDQPDYLSQNQNAILQQGSQRKPVMVMGRDILWGLNTWFNSNLKAWLKDFCPQIIFFYAGGSVFSEKIVLKIAKYLDLPIVTYWVDDHYLNNSSNKQTFIAKINRRRYLTQTKKLMKKSSFIALSDFMCKAYEQAFDKKGEVIYTTSSMLPFQPKHGVSQPLKMSFLGNISWDRYKSLIDIAKCIEDNDLDIQFDVYTAENRKWILNNIVDIKGLNFRGAIPYSQVQEVMRDSDLLVHVEDFSQDSINGVQYSLSTKIADSLSCNRCLFAYGPKSVASIDYLLDANCAFVCTDKQELKDKLQAILKSKDRLAKMAEKGLEVANANHNPQKNLEKLQQILTSLAKDS